jgi:hypothetical protein
MSRARVDESARIVTALMFGYEAAAIFSGHRLPTISDLCSRHRWLAAAAVLGLAAHLIMSDLSAQAAIVSA